MSLRQSGGSRARPDRAFDGGGQAGLDPVAGQKQVAPACLGAGAAGVLVGVNKWLFPKVQRINLFEYFRVTSGEVWSTSLMLLAIGCLVGVIGSTFAVWRYLDV